MASGIRTADELLQAGDMGRCELLRGELIMMLPAGGRHGKLAMLLGRELANFVVEQDLGTVVAAETGFVLAHDPDTVRAPDAAFLRAGRDVLGNEDVLLSGRVLPGFELPLARLFQAL